MELVGGGGAECERAIGNESNQCSSRVKSRLGQLAGEREPRARMRAPVQLAGEPEARLAGGRMRAPGVARGRNHPLQASPSSTSLPGIVITETTV